MRGFGFRSSNSLDQNLFNRFSKIDLQSLLAGNFEFARIEAELMQNGRVNVGDIVPVLHSMESQLVGCAMSNPTLYTATRQEG